MTYARARLWLGISGVGLFVVLAPLALVRGWPDTLRGLDDVSALGCTLAVYLLVSLPFDLLGGYVLPRRFGRRSPPFPAFVARWLKGVLVQALVMLGFGLVILEAGRAQGLVGGAAVYGAGMLLLVLFQGPLGRLVGSLRVVERRDGVTLVAAEDEGFTGGVVGPPGAAQIVVPTHWQERFGPDTTRVAISRRSAVTDAGSRVRGLGLAAVWNLTGFILAALLVPGAGVTSAVGLVTLSLGAVLWSFLGLLLLPSLSRPAVLEADARAMRAQELSRAELETAITALDRLQDDEPERPRFVERVFHPLPSVRSRLDALREARPTGSPAVSGWHTARNALYLSWACFGFLSRAVHCNAGRPDLWVMLPSD